MNTKRNDLDAEDLLRKSKETSSNNTHTKIRIMDSYYKMTSNRNSVTNISVPKIRSNAMSRFNSKPTLKNDDLPSF